MKTDKFPLSCGQWLLFFVLQAILARKDGKVGAFDKK
jgi:hypothetical protein